jgi:hypothetical protein
MNCLGLRGEPYRENRENSPQSDAVSDFVDTYPGTHPWRDDWAVFRRREFRMYSDGNRIAVVKRIFSRRSR